MLLYNCNLLNELRKIDEMLGKPHILCFSQLVTVLFVCSVASRSKSSAMVMAGQSVHLTTLFPGQA